VPTLRAGLSRRSLLRAEGAKPERTNALIAACGAGQADAVRVLLGAGADPAEHAARDATRRTPLHAAAAGRAGTPGCQSGYMDHTGCHQLLF
jgi:ankyrin repeat protein